ncbi:MAG: D-alanine--D-alanine ligase [Phycisphaeraceae bacterium]|nr:MAG: D-alanine--D-alanine ligase [Phycisphaeraceae bacterium]
MSGRPSVLVLGGGPGAEREISLASARGVGDALREAGHEVHAETIGAVTLDQLRAMQGDVVFPVLHGSWGEGGPLQELLERDGRPFVGSRAGAARLAMDKVATKMEGARLGMTVSRTCLLNRDDAACPLPLPVVVKPVHEGSSVGLMMCHVEQDWDRAHERVRSGEFGDRVFLIEPLIRGRELTAGLLAGENGTLRPLPLIEIVPAAGVYDYEAKYTRGDTKYLVGPDLPAGVADRVRGDAVRLANAIGVRHLCRVDFLLDEHGAAWLLELNTMPGFTPTSLLPKAARHEGIEMPALVSGLVNAAMASTKIGTEV